MTNTVLRPAQTCGFSDVRRISPNRYQCAICGRTFDQVWADQAEASLAPEEWRTRRFEQTS